MNSETSTDALSSARRVPATTSHQTGARDGDAGFEPWQLFTLAGLMGATVVVFMSRGQTPAGIILLSLIIFTAAVVGVAAWRTMAPFTGSDLRAAPTVLGGRTRAALERDKTLVLRAIKELEFDRGMGKVSQPDFEEMSGRLRARAARLIAQLDAGGTHREEIEREIARRLGEPPPESQGAAIASNVERRCRACEKTLDLDARFCKHCGASAEPPR
jgi:hypothetical protein